MKKVIATLIAGLFATAAFAQTPAVPAKAEAKHTKEVAKAEAKETKAVVKADAKEAAVAADAKADVASAKADAAASKAKAHHKAKKPRPRLMKPRLKRPLRQPSNSPARHFGASQKDSFGCLFSFSHPLLRRTSLKSPDCKKV